MSRIRFTAVSAGALLLAFALVNLAAESGRGYIGVATAPVGAELAKHLELDEGTGLTVTYVDPEGAAVATLKEGDILLRLNDQILVDPRQLAVLVRAIRPGTEVDLTLIRQGAEIVEKIELGAASESQAVIPDPAEQRQRWQRQPVRPAPRRSAPAPRSMWGQDMQRELEERMGAFQNSFGDIDDMLRRLREQMVDPHSGGSFQTQSSSAVSITRMENGTRMTYTRNNGDENMRVVDADGEVVFDGPIDSDEALESLPPEALRFLESINVDIHFEPSEEVELIPSDAI